MKALWIAVAGGILAIAAGGAAAAAETSQSDAKEAMTLGLQAYAACIQGQGQRMQGSQDVAEVVASAAVLSCSQDRVQAQQFVMLDLMLNSRFDVQKAGLVSEAFLADFDASARQRVATDVSKARGGAAR